MSLNEFLGDSSALVIFHERSVINVTRSVGIMGGRDGFSSECSYVLVYSDRGFSLSELA
jgi:hypothetical protein